MSSTRARRGENAGTLPWPWLAALGAALLILWLQAGAYPKPFSSDDAFIAFRYAENAALGHGLVFNPGEAVEGYTSFLWVILLAAAKLLGLDLPTAARGLGLFFSSATLVLVALWPLRLEPKAADARGRWLWGAAAALLLASSHSMAYHSVIGLETTCAAFLLTAALFLTDWKRGLVSPAAGLFWLLALLTRPEAVLWAGAAWILCWWRAHHQPGESRPGWRRWVVGPGLAATGFALFLGWRLAYYGQLLPNTYFAKRGFFAGDLRSGTAYLLSWILGGHGLIVLAALGVLALRDRRRLLGWSLPLLSTHVAAVVWTGGDHMWLWRFMVPFLPLESLLIARAALDLPGLVPGANARRRAILTSLILLAAMGGMAVPGLLLSHTIRQVYPRYDGKWIFLGRRLAGHISPSVTIALSPVGAIPYFTGATTIDILGLTEPHVARAPVDRRVGRKGHQHHDGHWVLERRPDLLILGNGIVVGRRGAPEGELLWYPELAVFRGARIQRGAPLLWPRDARMLTYEEDIWEDPLFNEHYLPRLIPLDDGLFLLAWQRKDVSRITVSSGKR